MSAQPVGETVEAGIDNAFCDVLVIQHIPDPPTELFFDDKTAGQICAPVQKSRDIDHLVRNHGEEGVLVDDPGIQRGRLDNNHAIVLHVFIILLETVADFPDHVDGEDRRIIFADACPVFLREHSVQFMNIDAPDHSIMSVHHLQIILRCREMEGNDGRKGPVQEPGGQSVMLSQDHLIPDGVLQCRFLQDRVFGEIEQQGRLKDPALVFAVPAQTCGERKGCIRFTAVDKKIAVAAQIFTVFLLGNHFKKIVHGADFDFVDHGRLLSQ